MNKKGFVFVETLVTTAILLVALVAIYVSYSVFIVNEKKRLYYDDISYIYKTIYIRDVMYRDKVFYHDASNNKVYYNADALSHWNTYQGNHYYYIGPSQQMFYNGQWAGYSSSNPYLYASSEDFKKAMDDNHVEVLIYIPKVSDITQNDILQIQKRWFYVGNYLKKLNVPCETDTSCNLKYKGIIISVIKELKNGEGISDDLDNSTDGGSLYNNYEQCMSQGNKTTMQCQEANYISWVYA